MAVPPEHNETADPLAKARCWGCNYPLRGLTSSRCPECGRPFDVERPETLNLLDRPVPAWARWLMRPVGWVTHLLAVWAMAYPIWQYRRPGGGQNVLDIGTVLWTPVVIVWACRLVYARELACRYQFPRSDLKRGRGHWYVAPSLFVAWLVLSCSGLPQSIAFRLSRPALERYAAEAMQGPAATPSPRRAGLYWVSVDSTLAPRGGIHISTGMGGYENRARCGFVYCPDGKPPATDEPDDYSRIDEKWYNYWIVR